MRSNARFLWILLLLAAAPIAGLGLGIAGQCPTLAGIYGKTKERELRKGILQAIMICGDAKALVRIAREEDDPELKAAAVRNLGNLGSPEATDFLMELLDEK